MAKTATDRLAELETAETAILKAQEVRGGDIQHRRAELAEVRAAIKDVKAQLRRETDTANGRGGVRYKVANMNRGN